MTDPPPESTLFYQEQKSLKFQRTLNFWRRASATRSPSHPPITWVTACWKTCFQRGEDMFVDSKRRCRTLNAAQRHSHRKLYDHLTWPEWFLFVSVSCTSPPNSRTRSAKASYKPKSVDKVQIKELKHSSVLCSLPFSSKENRQRLVRMAALMMRYVTNQIQNASFLFLQSNPSIN